MGRDYGHRGRALLISLLLHCQLRSAATHVDSTEKKRTPHVRIYIYIYSRANRQPISASRYQHCQHQPRAHGPPVARSAARSSPSCWIADCFCHVIVVVVDNLNSAHTAHRGLPDSGSSLWLVVVLDG